MAEPIVNNVWISSEFFKALLFLIWNLLLSIQDNWENTKQAKAKSRNRGLQTVHPGFLKTVHELVLSTLLVYI